METLRNMSLSNSQPATPGLMIHSPSPLRKATASRLSSTIARELFNPTLDQVETDPFRSNDESPSSFMKAKLMSLKGESDSSSNEWSSDSGFSTLDFDCESPLRKSLQRNPFNHDQIFVDIAVDVPARASNPIVNDANFKKMIERQYPSRLVIPPRAGGKISEFY